MSVIKDVREIHDLLERCRTIAVVGISTKPDRDSHTIAAYLKAQGYSIVGVNPAYGEVLGDACYASLTDMPQELRDEVDLVLVFRRPEAVPELLEEASALGLENVWLQLGVSSPRALEVARNLALNLVAEACIRVVHHQLQRRG